MKLDNIILGLEILKPYYVDPNGYHMNAEHDEIHLAATNKPLTEADAQRMRDLGWFQEDADNNEATPPPYDPEDGWSAFV